MDIQRMRACAPLLPPPGDEVVLELLQTIERLISAAIERETLIKEMRAVIQMLRLDTDQQGIMRQRIDDVLAAREEDV